MKVFRDIIRVLDAEPSSPALWFGLALFNLVLLGAIAGQVGATGTLELRHWVALATCVVVFSVCFRKLGRSFDF